MTRHARPLLQGLSVLAFTLAVFVALMVLPRSLRAWLLPFGFAGIVLSISSAVAHPRELVGVLVLCVAPVVGLVAVESMQWLMAPLATLLLIGAELNAWSWAAMRPAPPAGIVRYRVRSIARLGGLALMASGVAAMAARLQLLAQPFAVVLGALAIAGLGWMLFRRTGAAAGG